jgi:putative protease
MNKKRDKPELLLPAGKPEAFRASLEGGADAVYMGLKKFNARNRALNFTLSQLQAAVLEAHRLKKKVFLTLNTVVKNRELPELVSLLYKVNQTGVDAVIIQDWGVFHLIHSYFPRLRIHASTQMGNHNSAGARISEHLGFERIIYARELTETELAAIRSKSKIGMEIFIHGALCYSVSGSCLFSSFLGGFSANRGVCMQPCRRNFKTPHGEKYLFSLKDNQLIDQIPRIIRMGADALKIEGRIKSAEYVFTVAKAYRMAIDFPDRIEEAKHMLSQDMGREKTSYFFGRRVRDAMTGTPASGEFLGIVTSVSPEGFFIRSESPVHEGQRIRVQGPNDEPRFALTVSAPEQHGDRILIRYKEKLPISGDSVYLAASGEKRFSTGLKTESLSSPVSISKSELKKILSALQGENPKGGPSLYVRIDSLEWLDEISDEETGELILRLKRKEWESLNPDHPLLKKNRKKVIFELPAFIPESGLARWQRLLKNITDCGFTRFMLGHLSQKWIVPYNAEVLTDEHIYVFNDAAAVFLRRQHVSGWVMPFENDIDNLFSARNRSGIVPLYFHPELFYSRMPVQSIGLKDSFSDGRNTYLKKVRDGITIIIPIQPVALFQFKDRLARSGYSKFLIDLSYTEPSAQMFRDLFDHYQKSSPLRPSALFNFKRGLK